MLLTHLMPSVYFFSVESSEDKEDTGVSKLLTAGVKHWDEMKTDPQPRSVVLKGSSLLCPPLQPPQKPSLSSRPSTSPSSPQASRPPRHTGWPSAGTSTASCSPRCWGWLPRGWLPGAPRRSDMLLLLHWVAMKATCCSGRADIYSKNFSGSRSAAGRLGSR